MTSALQPPRDRVLGALCPVLVMLASFGVALAVLLAVTPLWELPDTFCQRVVNPTGGICADITTRREFWIVWVLVVTALLGVAARYARRSAGRIGPIVTVLLVIAPLAGLGGAAYLTVGRDQDSCGSTLSRLDPDGSYSPGRPQSCAPSYAADRRDAWILGAIGGAAALAAGAIGFGSAHRSRSVTTSRTTV